jgi:predicted transcriptional regulator
MTTKQDLHRLIDELPESALPAAAKLLEELADGFARLPAAFRDAPLDDEPLTPDELAGIKEGEAEIARGQGIPWEIVRARLLGDD